MKARAGHAAEVVGPCYSCSYISLHNKSLSRARQCTYNISFSQQLHESCTCWLRSMRISSVPQRYAHTSDQSKLRCSSSVQAAISTQLQPRALPRLMRMPPLVVIGSAVLSTATCFPRQLLLTTTVPSSILPSQPRSSSCVHRMSTKVSSLHSNAWQAHQACIHLSAHKRGTVRNQLSKAGALTIYTCWSLCAHKCVQAQLRECMLQHKSSKASPLWGC